MQESQDDRQPDSFYLAETQMFSEASESTVAPPGRPFQILNDSDIVAETQTIIDFIDLTVEPEPTISSKITDNSDSVPRVKRKRTPPRTRGTAGDKNYSLSIIHAHSLWCHID